MLKAGIHETKTHLSKLLRRVSAGEEVLISRGGVPVAKLVPVSPLAERQFGRDRGLFEVPEDFDAPLPDDVLAAFEGSEH